MSCDAFTSIFGCSRGRATPRLDACSHEIAVEWFDPPGVDPAIASAYHVRLIASMHIDLRGNSSDVALAIEEARVDDTFVRGRVHTWSLKDLYARRSALENAVGYSELNPGTGSGLSCLIPSDCARELFTAMDAALLAAQTAEHSLLPAVSV